KKQRVQVLGLGVDFDRETTKTLERTAQIGMEVWANLIRQDSLAVLGRKDEMNVDFGEGLSHAADSSTHVPICQAGFSRPFRPQEEDGCPFPRASAFGLSPGLEFSRPVGPTGLGSSCVGRSATGSYLQPPPSPFGSMPQPDLGWTGAGTLPCRH